jgi:hypothetical protein
MAIPTITAPPEVPVRRNMAQDIFEAATANFLAFFAPLTTDLITMIAWIDVTAAAMSDALAQVAALISTANLNANAILSRATNTILASGDNTKTVVATAVFTQTLTAAATLGTGWFCYVRNKSGGVITIDPSGAELINGAATYAIAIDAYVMIVCNAVGFTVIPLSSGAMTNQHTERAIRRARQFQFN